MDITIDDVKDLALENVLVRRDRDRARAALQQTQAELERVKAELAALSAEDAPAEQPAGGETQSEQGGTCPPDDRSPLEE